MLNRLNISTSFLALSLSLAIIFPFDMAIGMDDQLDKVAAYNHAKIEYDKGNHQPAAKFAKLSIAKGGTTANAILGVIELEANKNNELAYIFYSRATGATNKVIAKRAAKIV